MDDQERKIYEKYIINTVRDRDALNTAKEEGLKEGLKEGEIIGELRAKIDVAKNALKSGIPIPMISSLLT